MATSNPMRQKGVTLENVTQDHYDPDGPPTKGAMLWMLKRCGFKCQLSGRELTEQTATVDHIKPIERGGANVCGNMQIIHCDVNRAKNTMENDVFIDMCCEVARCVRGMG